MQAVAKLSRIWIPLKYTTGASLVLVWRRGYIAKGCIRLFGAFMSCSLNSLKGGSMRDDTGEYYGAY